MKFRLLRIRHNWNIDPKGKEAWCKTEAEVADAETGKLRFFLELQVDILVPLLGNSWSQDKKEGLERLQGQECARCLELLGIDITRQEN